MSAARHEPILEAIASGDTARALAVLKEHNDVARARIVANLT
jgi:DNA-binding GntR family transcriptional regulator